MVGVAVAGVVVGVVAVVVVGDIIEKPNNMSKTYQKPLKHFGKIKIISKTIYRKC